MFFKKVCVAIAVGGLLGSFALAEKGRKDLPIGQVTTSALVNNTPVPPGTTVFAGAVVSTQAKGAVIHLSNGESVELAPDSAVSFHKEGDDDLQMGVRSGRAKVRTAGGKVLSAMPEGQATYSSKQGWSLKGASNAGAARAQVSSSKAGGHWEAQTLDGSKGQKDVAKLNGQKGERHEESLGKKPSGDDKRETKPSKTKPKYDDDDDEDDENEDVASPTKPEKKRKKE